MDANNPVVRLCVLGSRAEFDKRHADAWDLYAQAWDAATNDYEACIAAHYVARGQTEPALILHWNQESLTRAETILAELSPHEPQAIEVSAFLPSLYLNMGRSCELMGAATEAADYYARAAALGAVHQPD